MQLSVLGWAGVVYGCWRVFWAGSLIQGLLGQPTWASAIETAGQNTGLLGVVTIASVPLAFGLIIASVLCLRQNPPARPFMLVIAIASLAVFGLSVCGNGSELWQMIEWFGFPEIDPDMKLFIRLILPCGFPIWIIITMFKPAARRALEASDSL